MTAVYKAMQNKILPSTSLSWQSAWKTVKKKSIPGLFVKLCHDLKDVGLIFYSFQFTCCYCNVSCTFTVYSRITLRGTGLFHFAPCLTLRSLMKLFNMHLLANVHSFQGKNSYTINQVAQV